MHLPLLPGDGCTGSWEDARGTPPIAFPVEGRLQSTEIGMLFKFRGITVLLFELLKKMMIV